MPSFICNGTGGSVYADVDAGEVCRHLSVETRQHALVSLLAAQEGL